MELDTRSQFTNYCKQLWVSVQHTLFCAYFRLCRPQATKNEHTLIMYANEVTGHYHQRDKVTMRHERMTILIKLWNTHWGMKIKWVGTFVLWLEYTILSFFLYINMKYEAAYLFNPCLPYLICTWLHVHVPDSSTRENLTNLNFQRSVIVCQF